MSECDRCGQEDPYCQCELHELRKRVERLENVVGQVVFGFKELCSAPEVSAPQAEEASETGHKDSAPQ